MMPFEKLVRLRGFGLHRRLVRCKHVTFHADIHGLAEFSCIRKDNVPGVSWAWPEVLGRFTRGSINCFGNVGS